MKDAQEAVRLAERILEELRTPPITLGERETIVDASIGAALGNGTRDGPRYLLRKADLALYRAKSRGKAGYEVLDPTLDELITP